MNLNVIDTMANARNAMTDDAFQQAGSVLNAAKRIIREETQKKSSSQMKSILDKLQSFCPISAEEIDLIKTWIVGDAEGYLKMENSFQDWLSEYDRLEKTLAGYKKSDCTSEELLELQGILEDASRISYDIAKFLESHERVKKIESALADGLDEVERDTLVKVLKSKLHSQDH